MLEVEYNLGRDRFTLKLMKHECQGSSFALVFVNSGGHRKYEVFQVGSVYEGVRSLPRIISL